MSTVGYGHDYDAGAHSPDCDLCFYERQAEAKKAAPAQPCPGYERNRCTCPPGTKAPSGYIGGHVKRCKWSPPVHCKGCPGCGSVPVGALTEEERKFVEEARERGLMTSFRRTTNGEIEYLNKYQNIIDKYFPRLTSPEEKPR